MRKSTFTNAAVCSVIFFSLAVAAAAQSIINTVAGGGPNNLPATSSAIGTPYGIARDGNGNTYISDTFSNRVFKVDGTGKLTVAAGNITAGYTQDGQLATVANLNGPEGVAVDSSGNLYIADTGNNVIRFVNMTGSTWQVYGSPFSVAPGQIATIVGTGTACNGAKPCGDGGAATSATLTSPAGVWLDSNNNIYIADTVDDVIRKVDAQSGTITTVAGEYVPCSAAPCGDEGAATNAQLYNPAGVWLDANNNIYIADTFDQVVREVTATSGIINSIAGNYGVACPLANKNCGDGGPATGPNAYLNQPDGVFGDNNGNIYIADTGDDVVRVVNGGNINLVAGTYHTACSSAPCGDKGAATSATLNSPQSLLVDGSGNLLIADENDDAIREVTAPVMGGNIQTAMGIILVPEYSGDGNPATYASLYTPSGVATDAAGNLYIADAQNNVVRVVNNQKTPLQVGTVTIPPGAIATVAGTGVACSVLPCGDDGVATAAQLDQPGAVAVDSSGNIYILDTFDLAVRVVNTQQASPITVAGVTIPAGEIYTVAGNGNQGDTNACPATSATLNVALGLTLDAKGNIYIADGNFFPPGPGIVSNNIIRVVNTQNSGNLVVGGVTIGPTCIATVAGTAQTACTSEPNCGDGSPATEAWITSPTGVALDGAGNIYIADNGDNRIRFVNNNTGFISTIAGTGAACPTAPCGDGTPATQATLDEPFDVYVDYAGTVYVADSDDSVVRAFTRGGDINTVAGTYVYGFAGDGGPATSAWLAFPLGLGADSAGDLLITDYNTWRVRSVSQLVVTAPTASPSPSPLVLPGAIANKETSNADITITNNGNGTNLTVSALTISGGNASGDFKASGCSNSVPPNGGSCTVTVSFTPSAVGNRTATLTITDNATNSPQMVGLSGAGLAATATAISSSANPSTVNTAVTFTATVTGTSGSGGTVTFNDGSAPLGSPVALSNGVAAIKTSSLTAGIHSITAVYSGDANAFLAGSTSAALQQVVSATFKIVPITDSVSAGSSATYTISVSAQDGFSGSVTLICLSGLPSGAACQFSPNPVALGASSTLTITTTSATASLAAPAVNHRSTPLYAIWLLLPAMLLGTAGLSAPQRKKVISYFLLALALAGLLFLLACGGSSSGGGSSGGGGGGGGTPAGTYTITIQGSSGSVTAKQTVTLTVS